MNINIYLEDSLAKALNQYSKNAGQSRNAIIREAIKDWVSHHAIKKWPASISKFQGVPKITPFESHREDLLPPDEEPLK